MAFMSLAYKVYVSDAYSSRSRTTVGIIIELL